MPRPTAAQLAYGSFTVIFSTLAMLLLSQTSSGVGIAVIAIAGLALGLLVAMTVPLPRQSAVRGPRPVAALREAPAPVVASVASVASEPVHERAAS
ncbi:hypothetical protein OG985_28060 [Streptomyces sp. NBC_00289]|uniref:hypothetical protein n=1 Tax=Streptomyces sp. NBC_00289 TaxID=2975703 RepID=UPI00324742BB